MRVSLFITCYNDTLYPRTGRAVVRLLERLGVDVAFKREQTCCGQMHANTGFRRDAAAQARRFVELYQDAEAILIPSASCVAMIRDQYPDLIAGENDPGLQKALSRLLPRVYELTEYLADVLEVEDVGAWFPHRVTFHSSCHGLRSLRLGDRPFRLLAKVRSLTHIPLPNIDRCCGFGGTFAIKNGDVSSAMLAEKLQDAASTAAEYCTAVDNSCLMHLGGAMHRQFLPIKTLHLAEILANTEEQPFEPLG
jgi:L-lactate dehydrogenase complex protein LldE